MLTALDLSYDNTIEPIDRRLRSWGQIRMTYEALASWLGLPDGLTIVDINKIPEINGLQIKLLGCNHIVVKDQECH